MTIQGRFNITNVEVILVSTEKYKLVSDHDRALYQWILHSILCQAIAVFGTVANCINMICFIKQGFKDPVNVTLFGLAISDLGCLVTIIWLNICMAPMFQESDLPFDVGDMIYLGAGWPHCIFARVTSFLTAFITLERCLCIAMPLKVARIFTSKRVCIVVVSFFVILIASVSPIYYVNRFAMVFRPSRNRTVLGIVLTEGRMDVLKVSLAVNNVVIPFGAFAIIIVCTAILVISLHRNTKWRQSAGTGKSETISRDQKVSRMILMMSSVFIICFIPACATCFAVTIEPRIEMYGQYRNTFIILFGFSFALESANSSVNILVYYRMSSKFRATFRELFGLNDNVKQTILQGHVPRTVWSSG